MIMRNIGKQCKDSSLKKAIFVDNKWEINYCKSITKQHMLSGGWISGVSDGRKQFDIEI